MILGSFNQATTSVSIWIDLCFEILFSFYIFLDCNVSILAEDDVPSGFPKILHHPVIKSVEKGGNAVMICQVDGNPPPEVIWLKDSIPIEPDTNRYTLLDQGPCWFMLLILWLCWWGFCANIGVFNRVFAGSLQIRQTVEQDEGEYECLAKNSHGALQSLGAKLYVKGIVSFIYAALLRKLHRLKDGFSYCSPPSSSIFFHSLQLAAQRDNGKWSQYNLRCRWFAGSICQVAAR